MSRAIALSYALVAYFAFFIVFLWFVAFVGDIRAIGDLVSVPTTVDAARLSASAGTAAIIDVGLVALFGLHHSIAARTGFKDSLTKSVPRSVERSTYVLVASLLLAALMWFWHPIDQVIWSVGGALATSIWVLFGLGWVILFTATWLLDHFELFGLRQAWRHNHADGPAAMEMRTPFLYKMVRHPIYLGFFIALWATPEMTLGHLVLAAAMTLYIFIGIHYEERDLVANFGPDYETYRQKVGALIPWVGRKA